MENRSIPVGPTGEISIQIVRPPNKKDIDLPAVIYLHGGDGSLADQTLTTDW
jgi:acetyl esterase